MTPSRRLLPVFRLAVTGACVLLLMPAFGRAADRSPRKGLWYANSGTRIYPDQQVPTSWDAETGKNIRWKASLSNWSNGSPLIVAGKVFVMSEPLDYAPILTCIDAESGRKLWQREVDPILAFPAGDQARLRKLAQDGWAWNRKMITLWNDAMDEVRRRDPSYNPKRPRVSDDLRQHVMQKFQARFDELGLVFKEIKHGAGGAQTYFDFKERRGAEYHRVEELKRLGLCWEHWSYFGTWNGNTFGTPASDGERVFVSTGNNVHGCHDLDGNLLWLQRFPWPHRRKAKEQIPAEWLPRVTRTKGNRSKVEWPYNTQGLVSTSPICVDGMFISCTAAWIRCFESKSGGLIWQIPMRGGIGQNCMTPGAIELKGEMFVIVPRGEGPTGEPGDDIIRVRDGKICGILPGYASAKMSIAGPIIQGDTVVNYSGHWRKRDISLYRLSYDGRQMVDATQVWKTSSKAARGLKLWRVCLKDGQLYSGSVILDAANGKVLAQKLPDARRRYCWWSSMIVGPYYLSIDHDEGSFVFRELNGRKKVGEATLPTHNPEVYDEARVRSEERGATWSVLGAATPIAYRNRLYVRSYDYLWCIGR